jgi:hypothetical protein
MDLPDKTTDCRDEAFPLMHLPPELRVIIYEYAFTSNDDPETVNLLDPHPPQLDLALTSREVYNEAIPIFERAYRAYWSTSGFLIKNCGKALRRALRKGKARLPSEQALSLITRVRVLHGTRNMFFSRQPET